MTIACFRLAFKPDIDDLRESRAVGITGMIAQWHSGTILAVEPNVTALREADVVMLLVDHRAFLAIEPEKIK